MIIKILLITGILGLAVYSGVQLYEDSLEIKNEEYIEWVPLYYNIDEPERTYTRDSNGSFKEVELDA